MKNNLEIGIRIRNIRENMKLSRSSFSEKLNISEVFLSQVERGEKSISLNTLIKICNTTGFTSDYILFGNTSNSSTPNRIMNILNELPPKASDIVYDMTSSLKDLFDNK